MTFAMRSTPRGCATNLGWEPRYGDFRSGLAATIDWYRANEAWWRPAKLATELKYERLGR